MKFGVKLGMLVVLLHTFTYIIIGWASVWLGKVKMINKDIEGNYYVDLLVEGEKKFLEFFVLYFTILIILHVL